MWKIESEHFLPGGGMYQVWRYGNEDRYRLVDRSIPGVCRVVERPNIRKAVRELNALRAHQAATAANDG